MLVLLGYPFLGLPHRADRRKAVALAWQVMTALPTGPKVTPQKFRFSDHMRGGAAHDNDKLPRRLQLSAFSGVVGWRPMGISSGQVKLHLGCRWSLG